MSTAMIVDGWWTDHPLVVRWDHAGQLPVRAVRPPARPRGPGMEAPPWIDSGPAGRPFDFTAAVRRLCADVVQRCAELRHVDLSRMLFAVTQARSNRGHGLQARLTPMRFRDGHLRWLKEDGHYQVQRFFVGRREILYVMSFVLPRFLDLPFDEKFITLFHELYHISPAFDGDLRRHDGRYSIHSHSLRAYDEQMAAHARSYLASGPPPGLSNFFRLTFTQLQHRHGQVVGVMVPRPKLIPVDPVVPKGTASRARKR